MTSGAPPGAAEVTVFIPPAMRSLCGGARSVAVSAATVRAVAEALEAQFPGFWDSLVEDGRLRPGLSIAVNSEQQPLGLLARVPAGAEVHILPAMSGG